MAFVSHSSNRIGIMVNVGLVGIGFMGWIHQLAYRRSDNARLAAFCSRDAKKRAGDWRGIQGNFGPPGDQILLDGIQTFETYDAMLRDANIDVVDICLPPHMHADAAVQAIEHGKDVFCEKPIALTAADSQRIMEAANANGRIVMVAHVLPYMGAFAFATEMVRKGTYGRPIGGYFKRVISDPTWIPDFYDPSRVGGPLVDLHVHDLHWIQLLFGKPKSVEAIGRMRGAVAEYVHVLYRFEDPNICVASSSGIVDAPARPFTHAFELHLENAALQHEFAAFSDTPETMPLKILTRDGQILRPDLPGGDEIDAFVAEIRDMAESVRTRQVAPRLSGQLAGEAVELALEIQSQLANK
ncbi:MAG: Gfo/Idh/MocA family oxidoreductase [Pirellula sp.]|jgi:predicted dehydrogenase|nr:Gfo/Idh/MocA family oxidoreductase [Pirellula sp.]